MSSVKRNPYAPKFMTADQLAGKLSVMNFGAKGGGGGGMVERRRVTQAADDDAVPKADDLKSVKGLKKAFKCFQNHPLDKQVPLHPRA